jgi:hypothetical protein
VLMVHQYIAGWYTLEGIVYMKHHIIREAFWKTQVESVIYAGTMGVFAGLYLF